MKPIECLVFMRDVRSRNYFEQMEWLRLVKDHIAASLSITDDDLDLSPFDRKGGRGGFYAAFGENYEAILNEMNLKLVS